METFIAALCISAGIRIGSWYNDIHVKQKEGSTV